MLSAVKLWKSSSICGPSATAKPISPKIATISSMVWLIGWMRPSPVGPHRQGHIDALGGEPGRERGGGEALPSAPRSRPRLASFSAFSSAPQSRRCSGGERAQRLHQPGDAALRPSSSTRSCLERVEIGRGGDALQRVLADGVEIVHCS